jgi:hypothetical protein
MNKLHYKVKHIDNYNLLQFTKIIMRLDFCNIIYPLVNFRKKIC